MPPMPASTTWISSRGASALLASSSTSRPILARAHDLVQAGRERDPRCCHRLYAQSRAAAVKTECAGSHRVALTYTPDDGAGRAHRWCRAMLQSKDACNLGWCVVGRPRHLHGCVGPVQRDAHTGRPLDERYGVPYNYATLNTRACKSSSPSTSCQRAASRTRAGTGALARTCSPCARRRPSAIDQIVWERWTLWLLLAGFWILSALLAVQHPVSSTCPDSR